MITALASTFNNGLVIEDCLDSIFEQSHQNFKLIVVNDGSTDNTHLILSKIKDPRLLYLEVPENEGVGAALNYALPFITTPFFAKVDCDDVCHKERFASSLDFLLQNPSIDFMKGRFFHFPDTEEVRRSERFHWLKTVKEAEINALNSSQEIQDQLPDWCCISHNTLAGKSEILQRASYPNIRMGEDYGLFLRLLDGGARFAHCHEAITYMRVSESSTVGSGAFHEDYFQMLATFKGERILKFLKDSNGRVTLVGTGKLASFFRQWIKKQSDIEIRCVDLITNPDGSSFYNCSTNEGSMSANEVTASANSGEKILLTCQPVRSMVTRALESAGLKRNVNFMVVA